MIGPTKSTRYQNDRKPDGVCDNFHCDRMNAVLLTGAGFTKTFGGYLASEMWATILNQPEVQNSPELLKGMRDLENLDYEMYYEDEA
jgi:hypothetical protein